MNRPTTVRIGAYTYTVHWGEDAWKDMIAMYEAHDLSGKTRHDVQTMWIKPGLGSDEEADVLLHECLHAIFARGCDLFNVRDVTNLEEYLVTVNTPWMLGFLRDNPKVIEYLTGRVSIDQPPPF